MKKAIFIISALVVASLLGGLALSCSPFDSPYYTEDEVCSAMLASLPSRGGGLRDTASVEYQGDHVWLFEATGVETYSRYIPPEYASLDDTASYEEVLEALRNPKVSKPGHYEWVYEDIKVGALFYERTGIVDWFRWQWPIHFKQAPYNPPDWTGK